MELWIRSQDRKELIPIKTKLEICVGDLIQTSINHYEVSRQCSIFHDNDCLGEYNSEQRALEVLDEIQSVIEHNGTAYYSKKEDVLYNLYGVYEMPEE